MTSLKKRPPPKNKPMEDDDAQEWFKDSPAYLDMCLEDDYDHALEIFMDRKGYRWSHTDQCYVDNGDLESEWVDRAIDEWKERKL